ncbi:zinc transporter 7-like [Hydractinia symbiolongicarpus]|uniref:zinc transporter 7-like n=1 Tax=Hydractinia symbiolongicarpus TaxID=13093 RepID=UPI002550F66D|nr:zinc transporter 7-like [Hydractinia symbiolongicarpus]
MLPLTHHDQLKGDDFKPGIKIASRLAGWLKSILQDKTSRNIFCFLLLNLVFAFLELFYGIWTNSLGLISDSFHMFFDCTALLTGLIATVISKWGRNERYSFGYVRAEIMAGFMNALFLMFVAFFIFSEAVERAFHPPHVEHERLFVISVLGFIVNLIGIFVFGHGHGDGDHGHSHAGLSHGHSHGGGSHGHSHANQVKSLLKDEFQNDDFHNDFHHKKKIDHGGHGHDHGGHGHSHGGSGHGHSHGIHDSSGNIQVSDKQIMQGVFLHILADTLGSVGVIISSLLIKYFGFMMADPLCSMLISILISLSIWPLLLDSMSILMQRTPKEIEYELPITYQRVSQIEGVYSVQDPHFWTLCSKNYVGNIRLLIAPQADASSILSQTHGIFNQIGVKQLYVQIERTY